MAKAWPIEGLAPEAPVTECARRIVGTRFREMLHYMDGAISGDDITQLHAMRVSTRRLRAALKNFRPCFDREAHRYHSRRIRDVARALGSVRDLDVRIRWLEGIRDGAAAQELPGIDLLVERARGDRERARGPMIELLERLRGENYEDEFLAFAGAAPAERNRRG